MGKITLEKLRERMVTIRKRVIEREQSVRVVAPRRITIEGQINKLRNFVKRGRLLWFNDLLDDGEKVTRTEVSVTLLAVLEMIKRREVNAFQEELFGKIRIEKANESASETDEIEMQLS